jgi:hypothetical protein
MADGLDLVAQRLGIPAQLIPAWKSMAGAPAPSAAPPGPAPGPAPGDPGFAAAVLGGPAPAPAAPPPPPGPRPGDPGFAAQFAPPPQAAPPPPRAPSRPGTLQEQIAASNASIEEARLARAGGQAPVALPGAMGDRLAAVSRANDAAATDADASAKAQATLEGATFYDPQSAPLSAGVAGGRPVMVSPGGRMTRAWQVQEGLELSPETKEAAEASDGHGRTAAGLEYMAGTAQAEYERGYLDRFEQAHARYAAEKSQRAQKYEAEYAGELAKLDDLRTQIREAQVDPFAGQSGFARFAGALAIGLGALRPGTNAGLEAVKHSIQTTLTQQEKEVERLERGLKGQTTFLGALKARFGDVEMAKEAAWVAYLEKAKVELAKGLSSEDVADPRIQARYEMALKQVDSELEHRLERWDGLTRDKVVRQDVNAPPVYAGGVGLPKGAEAGAKHLSEAYEKAGLPQTFSQLQDVDRVIDTLGDGDIPGVGVVAGKVPDIVAKQVWGDRAIAARQAVQSIKNTISHALFGGALSEHEAERLDKQIDGAKDAASLRRTVQSLRQTLHHKQRNIAAGVAPEAEALYLQRGGSVKPIQLTKPSTPHIREAK